MPALRELYLANNALGEPADIDWRWLLGPQITKTLRLLDLSGNRLKDLPKDIWKLVNLVTFKLDKNMLEKIPASLGRIRNLRFLTLSQNNLKSLPCSLMQCRFEQLDLSLNKFENKDMKFKQDNLSQWDFCVGSLVHISAKIVLRNNIFYAPHIIPRTLVETLDNANVCICGRPVLNNVYLIKQFDFKDCFKLVTLLNNNVNSAIDFECYFCSPKCLLKYM